MWQFWWLQRLLLVYLDKNHNRAIMVSKKPSMTNQLVKNLPTLSRDRRRKPKDWESSSDVASKLSRLGANERSVVWANNRYCRCCRFYLFEVCSWWKKFFCRSISCSTFLYLIICLDHLEDAPSSFLACPKVAFWYVLILDTLYHWHLLTSLLLSSR